MKRLPKDKPNPHPGTPDIDRGVEAIENRLRKLAPTISIRKGEATKRKG